MKVRFKRLPDGTIQATTTLRTVDGAITITARTTQAEARAIVAKALQRGGQVRDQIGFKLSFRALGRAARAIAKPATLLKVTTTAAALAANPALAVKLGPKLVGEIKRGMAAKRAVKGAEAGDPRAQRLLREAAVAADAPGPVPAPLGVPEQTWRLLVTLERLAKAEARA